MPKKAPKNAFFFFMLHFQKEESRRGRRYASLSEVSAAASKPWEAMTAQERGPFEKQAKDAKVGPTKEVEKYTSQGIAVSVIEKQQKEMEQEEQTMRRTIKSIVVDAFSDNSIASKPFFLISGNYFVITSEESYLPAEVAIVKFSFEAGIIKKFHTYVDPEKIPLGFQFSAKDHSEKTHRLPIPPRCKGEKNYQLILNEMKAFMGEPLPILFTSKENIPMIKSFIELFIDFGNDDDAGRFRVYPIHHLFFEIKETAVANSAREIKSFKSIHVAEQHLRREDYAYLAGTSCTYHEELDCAKYCALAHVQNWAYIFMDHICVDLNIELISGKQFPAEIDVSHLAHGARGVENNFSVSNMNGTNGTRNRSGIDEGHSSRSATASSYATHNWTDGPINPQSVEESEDFPTLGSRNRRRNAPSQRASQHVIDNPWDTSSSSSSDGNPWRQRRRFENDSDDRQSFVGSDANSSHSRGMGRGSALFRNESGFGRGRSHR